MTTFADRLPHHHLAVAYVDDLVDGMREGWAHEAWFQECLRERHDELAELVGSRDLATLMIAEERVNRGLEHDSGAYVQYESNHVRMVLSDTEGDGEMFQRAAAQVGVEARYEVSGSFHEPEAYHHWVADMTHEQAVRMLDVLGAHKCRITR